MSAQSFQLDQFRQTQGEQGQAIARLQEQQKATDKTVSKVERRVDWIFYGIIIVLLNILKDWVVPLVIVKKVGG